MVGAKWDIILNLTPQFICKQYGYKIRYILYGWVLDQSITLGFPYSNVILRSVTPLLSLIFQRMKFKTRVYA